MAFSIHQREDLLRKLAATPFDLLVVGGGITGAGIARDAALRGLRVALVERGDFAVGTSSRSTKLIHGGLRYLEMGDVGLVFEAVRERQRLLRIAPHLARPQSFVLPVNESSKHGVFLLDVGLTLYDALASFAGVMRHRALRKKPLMRMEPLLHGKGLQGGARYFDATTDDARLVLANVRGAHEAGAVPLSRVEVVAPIVQDGRCVGARVRDLRGSATFDVRALCIVAAVGPWSDEWMALWRSALPDTTDAPAAAPPLTPSKGVHVVVPRSRLPLNHAVTMTSHLDGRVVFALPWSHATVLGTTDTTYDGALDEPVCTWADAEYLVQTANGCLHAVGGPLQVADVVSTWAGIRPLVAQAGASSYKTSREHVITVDPRGLVAVAGGKLTTYRVMAQQAVDAALPLLPGATAHAVTPCATAELPLPGADRLPTPNRSIEVLTAALQANHGLDAASAEHFARRYGSDAESVLAACADEPEGGDCVLPDLPYRWGELAWLVREEMALDLVDLTVRRTQLYYVAGDRLLAVAQDLGRRMARWCGDPPEAARILAAGLVAYVVAHRVQSPPEPHAA
ncbi:MAG: glycerol-3-phosphate dehydrogenase/oxidase [Deltaproteobacteria bacterium]|nr:glycerol-3-phosphate dehydrogenase/oxidase [Deltaproteobacteria bacterium]